MNKTEFNKNAALYHLQISDVISKVAEDVGYEWADSIFKGLVGYAKGSSIWYADPGMTFDISDEEELHGVAAALGVHAEPLREFIEAQGGLTTKVCDWYEFAEGVRLYEPK